MTRTAKTMNLHAALAAAALLAAASCSKFPVFPGGGGPSSGSGEEAVAPFTLDIRAEDGIRTRTGLVSPPSMSVTLSDAGEGDNYRIYWRIGSSDERSSNIWNGKTVDFSEALASCTEFGSYTLSGTVRRADGAGEPQSFSRILWVRGERLTDISVSFVMQDGTRRPFTGDGSAVTLYTSESGRIEADWMPEETAAVPSFSTSGAQAVTLSVDSVKEGPGRAAVPFTVGGDGEVVVEAVLTNGPFSDTLRQRVSCVFDSTRYYAFEAALGEIADTYPLSMYEVSVSLLSGQSDAAYDIVVEADGKEVRRASGISLASPWTASLQAPSTPGTRTVSATVSRSDGNGTPVVLERTLTVRPRLVRTISVREDPCRLDLLSSKVMAVEPEILPEDATSKAFTASSSDHGVVKAEVSDGSVVLTAVSPGKADVTLTASDGGGASCRFQVIVTKYVVITVDFIEDPLSWMTPRRKGKSVLTLSCRPDELDSSLTVSWTVAVTVNRGLGGQLREAPVDPGTGETTTMLSGTAVFKPSASMTMASVEAVDVAGEAIWPFVDSEEDIEAVDLLLRCSDPGEEYISYIFDYAYLTTGPWMARWLRSRL